MGLKFYQNNHAVLQIGSQNSFEYGMQEIEIQSDEKIVGVVSRRPKISQYIHDNL